MDLKKAIVKEYSRANTDRIVQYIGDDQERFDMLVRTFLAGPYRVTQRAAAPLTRCVERNPALAKNQLGIIVDNLRKGHAGDAVKRNTIRLLQQVTIPKRLHGKVTEICLECIQNKREAVAIRVFSMSVLAKMASFYPELKEELKLILEDNLPFASPAFASRSKKVLKELDQL
jgi:hypothetical protein